MSIVWKSANGARSDVDFGASWVSQALFTVAGWFYIPATYTANTRLWCLYDSGGGTVSRVTVAASNQLVSWSYDGWGRLVTVPDGFGRWLYIAFSCDNNSIVTGDVRLTVWDTDLNELVTENTGLGGTAGPGQSDQFYLGEDYNGANQMDEAHYRGIRIFDTALTRAELLLEAAATNPIKTANVHADYGLQNAADNSDNSGNGHHLTFENIETGSDPPTEAWAIALSGEPGVQKRHTII